VLIPQTLLVASAPFAGDLPAGRVAAAIARGLRAGGRPETDLCPIEPSELAAGVGVVLEAVHFEARMRSARAVIICDPRLQERTLAGSVTFEIATRARQRGVPAYAVTGENAMSSFDARILDLQLVLEAGTTRSLVAAGRALARIV
jgi:glycerate kinase